MKYVLKSLAAACLGGALLVAPTAFAQREGVDVGENSAFTKLVSADEMEQIAEKQYRQTLREAAAQSALAPANNPQLKRLRAIAERIIPHALDWNPRAKDWKWEVNLIGSKQINA